MCNPVLVRTFPEWLSGTESWPPCVRPRHVCSVCVHTYSFAGIIRRTPPPTFRDTAIIDRHSDTTIFQLRAQWVQISWSIGSEKSFGHVPPVGVEPSTPCVNGDYLIHLARCSAWRYSYRHWRYQQTFYSGFLWFIKHEILMIAKGRPSFL